MRLTTRTCIYPQLAFLAALVLTGCAAVIPSGSSGSSEASFGALSHMPKRITVRSEGIPNYDPVGDVLRTELPKLGFTLVEQDAEGRLTALVNYSDFSPVRLHLSLTHVETGRTLWSAHVTREWDIYASVVSASKSNVKKAVELFRRDLALARARR